MILVAVRDVLLQQMLVQQLANLGRTGHSVSTGDDAKKAAGFVEYELIILDLFLPENRSSVVMPLMPLKKHDGAFPEGARAALAIRQQESSSHKRRVPIVGVTDGDLKIKSISVEAGVDDFIFQDTLLQTDALTHILKVMIDRWT